MASIDGNEQALDASIARALKSLGIVPSGDFAKLLQPQWIQDQGGVPYGPRVDVYQTLPRDPGAALLVDLKRTWYSLTLDPVWTTPQAMLSVSFEQPSSHTMAHQLVPGQTVAVPNGYNRFYVWANDYLGGGFTLALGILGYVRFLLGASAIDRPNLLGVKPHPLARLLGAATAVGQNQAGWVPTNVPRVRALIRGVTAGNVYSGHPFVAGMLHTTYHRNETIADIPLNETPDLFGGIQAQIPIGNVIASSFGANLVPTVRVRSEPGLANSILLGTVNDPNAVNPVTGIRPVIEAIDASEIERADFDDLVLFDFTTPVNVALDTGIVPVYGMRQLLFLWSWSAALAGAIVSRIDEVDDAGANHPVTAGNVGAAGTTEASSGWGPGCSFSFTGFPIPGPVPQRIHATVAAAGGAITTRLRIIGVPK